VRRGTVDAVRAFADALTSQRGVHYGKLHILPLDGQGGHVHGR
jgi:CopG family nickel-responsive transcriptional regulator